MLFLCWRSYISSLCFLFWSIQYWGNMTLIFSPSPSQNLAPQWIIEIGFCLWSHAVYRCLILNIKNKVQSCQLPNLQNCCTERTWCSTAKPQLNVLTFSDENIFFVRGFLLRLIQKIIYNNASMTKPLTFNSEIFLICNELINWKLQFYSQRRI